ncbi:glycosyltransferase family 2 protein [Echinicola strongylocentroti]|uniref:glycosyltransferase family 2 protein n=1 Tax=Echinicola strongylocentroti TaxID=1795355 RepID=UPI0013A704EE|nr:glycosyltransferase family A protein [Echinicola strongylocentroti]
MESQPFFSVIIPAFNRGHIIGRAISSVLGQSFQNFELIVVDDGSQDNTGEVVKQVGDERVRYFYQTNSGVSAARNIGANVANGINLIFLDSDDELGEEALAKFNSVIHRGEVIQFGFVKVNETSSILKYPEKNKFMSKLPGSFCIKRDVFKSISGYDERLAYSENTEMFHRLSLIGVRIHEEQFISLRYYESITGGSKNRHNKIAGLKYILKKHDKTVSKNVKFLYNQIIGVESFKVGDYQMARYYLFKALKIHPWAWKCIMRILNTYIIQSSQRICSKTEKN